MDLEKLDIKIREKVPMGMNLQESIRFHEIPFGDVQEIANSFVEKYNQKFKTSYVAPIYNEEWLTNKLTQVGMYTKKFYSAIGTLGGGNHFIEVGKSENSSNYWLTIHTGSRNFGLKIAEYWINVARGKVFVETEDFKSEMREIVENTTPKSEISKKIKDLRERYSLNINPEYLEGENLINYIFDMIFAQQYALWNRQTILSLIKKALNIKNFDEEVHSIHNYIDFKDFIIRKGAISSYIGEKMIIPFNMRDGILLCEGKSNEDWNNTAPHGSGRLMSRGKAKESVSLDDFKRVMKDIYSTSVCKSTIDESPFAYKNSKMIETMIEPTVTILDRIKPILNIKDKSEGESWKDRKAKKKKDENLRRERDEMSYRKMKRM
jgi:RNA-splicing ligase RtcB